MWILLALLHQAAADTYAAAVLDAGCANKVGCAGFYRGFVASTSPAGSTFNPPPSTVYGISAAAIGVQAATNGVTTAANVDVAGFRFKNPSDPADTNNQLNVYFGYLGASGVWNNNTATGAVVGAFLEISTSISAIQVYYDRDGNPGFQWGLDPSVDIYTCGAAGQTGTYDCIDTKGYFEIGKLTWSTIGLTTSNCSTAVQGANTYDPHCTVYTFNTTGSANGVPIITIIARTASQPIWVNNVLISPVKVKFDVDITVPWSSLTTLLDSANAKIGLIFVHAGRSASGGSVATVTGSGVNSVSSLSWNTQNGLASYYGYNGNATVDGNVVQIYTQVVTGAQIQAFNPPVNLLSGTYDLSLYLKTYVGVLQALGWVSSLTFHSVAVTHPTVINWDPEVGMAPSSTSASSILLPSFALALLALFF